MTAVDTVAAVVIFLLLVALAHAGGSSWLYSFLGTAALFMFVIAVYGIAAGFHLSF